MPNLTLHDIQYLNMDQFDAFTKVGYIKKLEESRERVLAIGQALGKNSAAYMNDISSNIDFLRKRKATVNDLLDSKLDYSIGKPVVAGSDQALENLGFSKQKE